MDPDLQEQPESTIGRKPAELKQDERGRAREGQEEERFARSRARREEAEESEVGDEIRARDAELDSADLAAPSAPSPEEPVTR